VLVVNENATEVMASASQAEGEREDGSELATRQVSCDFCFRSRSSAHLILRQIACPNKRIHIDLCRNDRGHFFKLSEIDSAGKHSNVTFPASGARAIANTFDQFAEFDESFGDSIAQPTLDAEGKPQVGFM
jgi:hypothetical protein